MAFEATGKLILVFSSARVCRRNSLPLHRVKGRICCAQETLNRPTVLGIDGNTNADGKLWSFAVSGKALTDTLCHQISRLDVRLW